MKLGFKILILFAAAGALAWLVYTLVGPGGATRAQLSRELEELRKRNQEQEEENRLLQLEVEALKDRPEYLEYLARSALGLAHPTDMIFLLDRPPAPPDAGPGLARPPPAPDTARPGD